VKLAATLIGITCAIFVHVAILLFGGIFFMDKKKDAGTVQTVDLLSDVDAEAKKDEKKPEEQKEEEPRELDSDTEQPPDAAEMLRSLEPSPIDNTPALEAASLSAIEAALGGQGGGEFAEALSFASGGKIGGTGVAGGPDQKMEEAFSLAEIDQKPRAVFQGSPIYPAEMRGKKVEGVVTLIFVVDATGKIVNPRVEKSSNTVFESPAIDALRKWKFEPGVRAGQSVATKMRVSIRFPPS
jgi:protein TonB